MPLDNTPDDGDFAGYLARREATSNPKGDVSPQIQSAKVEQGHDSASLERSQSIEDVVVHGEEPTEAFLKELSELEAAPDLSDDELASRRWSTLATMVIHLRPNEAGPGATNELGRAIDALAT